MLRSRPEVAAGSATSSYVGDFLGHSLVDEAFVERRRFHSGIVGEYVISVSTAFLGGVWALTLRGP